MSGQHTLTLSPSTVTRGEPAKISRCTSAWSACSTNVARRRRCAHRDQFALGLLDLEARAQKRLAQALAVVRLRCHARLTQETPGNWPFQQLRNEGVTQARHDLIAVRADRVATRTLLLQMLRLPRVRLQLALRIGDLFVLPRAVDDTDTVLKIGTAPLACTHTRSCALRTSISLSSRSADSCSNLRRA